MNPPWEGRVTDEVPGEPGDAFGDDGRFVAVSRDPHGVPRGELRHHRAHPRGVYPHNMGDGPGA